MRTNLKIKLISSINTVLKNLILIIISFIAFIYTPLITSDSVIAPIIVLLSIIASLLCLSLLPYLFMSLIRMAERVKIPYLIISLSLAGYAPILLIIKYYSLENIEWLTHLGFFWYMCLFLMLMFAERLRNSSINIFSDLDMPFSSNTKKIIDEQFRIYFRGEKLELMGGSNLYKFFYYFQILILCLLFVFAVFNQTPANWNEYGIIPMAFAGTIIAIVIIAHSISATNDILSTYLNLLGNDYFHLNYLNYTKIKELNEIPMNILYLYGFLFIYLSILFFPFSLDVILFEVAKIMLVYFVGFILVFLFPCFYVYSISKKIKKFYKYQRFDILRKVENRICKKSSSYEDSINYDVLINMIERIDRTKVWPLDVESFIKIFLTAVFSNIFLLLKIIYKL